jgi:FAD/FMN-containing dehydrogenase
VAAATSEVVRLANTRHGEGFIAVSAEARKKFWLDRARTAAIARHTNAFKINEDVVIPLNRMGEYTDHIERINIELSTRNKLKLLDALQAWCEGGLLAIKLDRRTEEGASIEEALAERRTQALETLERVRQRWQWVHDNLDLPLQQATSAFEYYGLGALTAVAAERFSAQPAARLFDLVQDRSLRISWKLEVKAELSGLFSGADFAPVMSELQAIHARVLKSRVFIALHMHAGDGNVHTNIPVNSDDYEMLGEANSAVARIMQIARDLDGVISGEHGIGRAKAGYYESLEDPAKLALQRRIKAAFDPAGILNPGCIFSA